MIPFGRRSPSLKIRSTLHAAVLAAAFGLLPACEASAGPPTDQLRSAVDQVLTILSDPELKKEARTLEQRQAIRSVANDIFDVGEVSRRSLGPHWQARTPAEREEFIGLFSELLEHSYLSKMEMYSGEKIQYVGETVDGDRAVVRTLIVTKQGTPIPVNYRMLGQRDRWRAYDVTIEGVSLVANYRAQFTSIIQRSGYASLVEKLRAKSEQRPEPRETGPRAQSGGAAVTAPVSVGTPR